MPRAEEWLVFLGTAVVLAFAPGPGILYVLARSLRGGRAEGVRSSLGNALGATVHVMAATVGLTALLVASAIAFTAVKLLGAGYLAYLGVRALLELRHDPDVAVDRSASRSALLQGLLTEVFNPKTAMFFLALLPQFVHPDRGQTALASLVLGFLFVVLALLADLLVASLAGPLGSKLAANRRWRRRLHLASGSTLIGLGGTLALSQN